MAEPVNSTFYNKIMDRTSIKQLISKLITHFGIAYTTHILDQLKTLGFRQATLGAISLGIDDLLTAPSKGWLIEDAEQYGNLSEKHHNYGNSHAVEKLRQLIETWYATSEFLKQEMNPNFGVTDPSNPVHMMSFSGARGSTSQVHQLVGMRGLMSDPQGQIIDLPIQSNFREGLSLTEYIISCYGARKGVVDTAVRTSDAGYLTRRLVEVVQHVVVRKIDCGTFRGIFINNLQRGKNLSHQELIGRVLAENIYINNRCFATRNQDIGASLADQLITSKIKPVSIRSPLTCKSMLWICQLCYGWCPTNGNLVEMGEAVGIIAGQSIGEPGTQLTLRTFHTGGVFTGDIAEHVRAPFNGVIEFNTNFVSPTRTRHGHPAWMCHTKMFLRIRNKNKMQDLIIPPKSLLLIQNNQYVESKQVIGEIRSKVSPFKEKIRRYIYSTSEGEIHWSTRVHHASRYRYSNIHRILKTCHIWVLSGNSYNRSNRPPVYFYKNQDKIDFRTFLIEKESFSVKNRNESNICIFGLNLSRKNKTLIRSGLTHQSNHFNKLLYSSIVLSDYNIVKRHENFFMNRKYENFLFILEMKKNGILQNKDVIASSNYSKYESEKSGIVKYGTVGIDSSKEYDFERTGTTARPRYKIVREGYFFLIPEEVHISTRVLLPLPVRSNEFIQSGVRITPDLTSRTSGLIKIRRSIKNTFEVKILPGIIYYPNETYKFSKQISVLIPPNKKLFNEFQYNHWTYLQWIIPLKEKPFVLIRPATEYQVSNPSNKINLLKLLRKNRNPEIKTVNFFLYGDGEETQIVNEKHIYLIETCLIVHWNEKNFLGKANVSFLKVRTKKNFRNFLQITLMNRCSMDHKKHGKELNYRYVCKRNYHENLFPITRNQLINKDRGIIRISSNHSGIQSFVLLSSSNSIEVRRVNRLKSLYEKRSINNLFSTNFFDFCKYPKRLDPLRYEKEPNLVGHDLLLAKKKSMYFFDRFGLIGNSQIQNFINPYGSYYSIITSKSVTSYLPIISRFPSIYRKWYFIDEYYETFEFFSGRSINQKLFERCLHSFDSPIEKIKSKILNLGQFIFGNFSIFNYGILPSGQIIGIHMNHLIIRLAKPYLTTKKSTIHTNYGESIKEGDTLITLIYERLQSGDIIQGLPRVEQLLEARSVNSVSINLENGFEDWSNDMKRFIGNLWGFCLGARIGTEQGQMVLVDQIRKVYQSQGVRISDKHIEIIVRQMTSKVVTSEEGMINIFLPGELIESSRAQRINRVLEELIPYEPVLLGITKASLNTRSFVSEASFQETTRVLAKAALKGRTDWLKGLKENVILGAIIPAGTGSQEVIQQITLEREKVFSLRRGLFNKQIKKIFLYGDKFQVFPAARTVHNVLRESLHHSINPS